MRRSFEVFTHVALAIDPIHVGTGGARLGRVDNTIVRDPVTRVPKIPGSSLAGVYRAYTAMATEGKYPKCAGLGQRQADGTDGHCGSRDCCVCTVYGFARGAGGGFAGLASFSDADVFLFPVPTRKGPYWVTAPMALRPIRETENVVQEHELSENALYDEDEDEALNLGWLMLPVRRYEKWNELEQVLKILNIPDYIARRTAVLPDTLFGHVVNSNLEVRTSVAIDPTTGAAQEQKLFTYEALPRGTMLAWEVTCRNPAHFRIGNEEVRAVTTPQAVHNCVKRAHPYLEHLGVGGMSTRGMGRLRVLYADLTKPEELIPDGGQAGHE
jgi:CRISPR-associated protein Cmr4